MQVWRGARSTLLIHAAHPIWRCTYASKGSYAYDPTSLIQHNQRSCAHVRIHAQSTLLIQHNYIADTALVRVRTCVQMYTRVPTLHLLIQHNYINARQSHPLMVTSFFELVCMLKQKQRVKKFPSCCDDVRSASLSLIH